MDATCLNELEFYDKHFQVTNFAEQRQRFYGSFSSTADGNENNNNNDDGITGDDDDDPSFQHTLTIEEGQRLDVVWVRQRTWFNVGLINAACFLLFTGVVPVAVIQSSLNSEQGLGVASLAVKSGFMVLGSVLAPSLMQKLGCKASIVVGTLLYVTYIPANFYPAWFTLIPLAAVAGVGCTLAMVANKVYLAKLANHYATLSFVDVDRVNSRIFVLMVCAFKLSSSVGNFVSSYILQSNFDDDEGSRYRNQSWASETCGINYCNQDFSIYSHAQVPLSSSGLDFEVQEENEDQHLRITLLITFCTTCGLLSVVLLCFVDPLKRFGIPSLASQLHNSPCSVFRDLIRAAVDPKHLLFIPTAMALNGGDSFWVADFTKAFVTCSLGMAYVGYVSLWSGLSGVCSCLLLGWFNNKQSRSLPVFLSCILQLATLTALFYWTPSASYQHDFWALSIFGIVFFLGSGTRHFIAPVLISVVFQDQLETAFSVFHFWTYVSSTLIYAWSNFLCISFKIYFLMTILALSFLGYVGMEILVHSPTSYSLYKRVKAEQPSF